MKLVRLGILSALLLLIAACGSTPTGSDATGSSPAPATATADSQTQISPQPSMTETATAGAPLITLTRSGGITGRTVTFVVQTDRTLQIIEGEIGGPVAKTGRATQEQIQELEQLLQSEAWKYLDPSYGQQMPDGFAYTLVGGSKTVQTYDAAPDPPVLADVLRLLDELWQQTLHG